MFHRRASLALSLLLLLNSLLLCCAANCYLSPSGSDENQLCNQTNPCATLGRCFDLYQVANLTISMSQGTYPRDGNCGFVQVVNVINLIIQAVPNNTVTIDCGTADSHFVFSSPTSLSSVTLYGLNLINGYTVNNGGCISADGIASLVVQNMAFQNCQAGSYGGAIYATFAVSILDCVISNSTAQNGGALYLTADASVSKCTITNSTATNGGGLYVTSSSLSVTNTNITYNTAQQGGGLYLYPTQANTVGTYNFAGTNISNNYAVNGGGLYAYNANYTWNIYGATFTNNNSTNKGDPNVMCDNSTAALFCYSCDANDCSSDCSVSNNNQSCSQSPSSSTVKCYTAKYSTCSATDSCTCQANGLPKAAKILIILIAICLFVGVVLIVADVVRHFIRKNQSGYTPIK